MPRIYVYAETASVAALAGLGAVAPKGTDIHVRDGARYRTLESAPDQAEESPSAVLVYAADPADPTEGEIVIFDLLDADYDGVEYFTTQKDDDLTTVNLVATGAVLTDSAIRIANTNRAPTVANALVNKTATELAAMTPYAFASNSFADADGASDTLTYSATLASGSALPGWLTFTPSTRTFSGTPGDNDAGTVSVRVKATDRAGAFVTDDFDIVISAN